MTQEFLKSFNQVWTANKEKQEALTKVINTTLAALCKDAATSFVAKSILGEEGTDGRKRFLEVFNTCMPHYVLNGTDKAIACDFVAATDSNKLTKTIRQYRLAVDSDIVKPEVCQNFIETEKEVNKTEKVKLASGYEIEVPSRDKDGNVLTETKKVQLVPRKKSAWGYTQDVKTAILNAMTIIEGAE